MASLVLPWHRDSETWQLISGGLHQRHGAALGVTGSHVHPGTRPARIQCAAGQPSGWIRWHVAQTAEHRPVKSGDPSSNLGMSAGGKMAFRKQEPTDEEKLALQRFSQQVGLWVYQYCVNRALSVRQFCSFVEIDSTSFSAMKSGRQNASLWLLTRVSKMLNVTFTIEISNGQMRFKSTFPIRPTGRTPESGSGDLSSNLG